MRTVAIALAAAATAGAANTPGYPVYCGGHTGRYVALTFDDGPGSTTATVIRTLRRFHARATFFVVGRNISGRAATIKQERAIGAVGNHSWSHPDLSRYSAAGVSDQLTSTQ